MKVQLTFCFQTLLGIGKGCPAFTTAFSFKQECAMTPILSEMPKPGGLTA